MEFPRVAAGVVGQKNRYGFTLRLDTGSDEPEFVGVLKSDLQTGKSELHDYGAGRNSSEPVFVTAQGADPNSDEGWVMSYVYDEGSGKSELVVLDATDMAKAPVARVTLPQRVPYGFHGSWIPDSE
jgi:carotenoid cleavage dioxygenase